MARLKSLMVLMRMREAEARSAEAEVAQAARRLQDAELHCRRLAEAARSMRARVENAVASAHGEAPACSVALLRGAHAYVERLEGELRRIRDDASRADAQRVYCVQALKAARAAYGAAHARLQAVERHHARLQATERAASQREAELALEAEHAAAASFKRT
jgi:hypothetical protein